MTHYLSASNTKALKGIMAVAVVLSHIYTSSGFAFSNPLLAFVFGSLMGYVPVSVFFFLSGYGLLASYKSKGQKYIQDFPKNRIIPFYIYCVCILLFYLCFSLALQEQITWVQLIKSFTLGGTIIQYGWYLQTILVLYTLFWACFSIKTNDSNKVGFFIVGLLLLYVIAFCLSITPTWYVTAPCMLLGMLWQVYSEKIDRIINTIFKKIVGIFLSLCACAAIIVTASFLPESISYNFQVTGTAIFFVVAIILSLKGLSLTNPITNYLGKISLEIYVFQGAVIKVLQRLNIANLLLYATFVLAGTILVAALAYPLLKHTSKITRLGNKSTI